MRMPFACTYDITFSSLAPFQTGRPRWMSPASRVAHRPPSGVHPIPACAPQDSRSRYMATRPRPRGWTSAASLPPRCVQGCERFGYLIAFRRMLARPPRNKTVRLRPPSRARSVMLTRPLTSFVGRQKELADVQHVLGEHRLVTLTG